MQKYIITIGCALVLAPLVHAQTMTPYGKTTARETPYGKVTITMPRANTEHVNETARRIQMNHEWEAKLKKDAKDAQTAAVYLAQAKAERMERERTNHEYAQRELAKKNVVTIREASPASHGEADIVLQVIAIEEQARQERQERRYRRETLNAFQDISRAIRGEPRPQRSFYGVPMEYIFGDS